MRLLIGGPLKAEAVAVGVVEVQLLHTIRCDLRLFGVDATGAKVLVSGVQIFAAEIQAGVVVGSGPRGLGRRGTLVRLVRGIEHQLRAIQLEPGPIAVIPRLRRSVNFEAEHVAIEMNRGWHVENLKEWSDAVNVHGEDPPVRGKIYQRIILNLGERDPL